MTTSVIFWLSLGGLAYIYVGYPLLIRALGKLFPFNVRKRPNHASVSVVVVGHNEADRLASKLDSIFACESSVRIIEVLIGSDGSNDHTAEVVAGYPDERARLIHFDDRRGKPAVLNDVVPQCQAEIVILTDARQTLDPLAVERLTAPLSDARVGVVSGELVFRQAEGDTAAAQGIGFYWSYEKFIRKSESRFRGVPGATGALYAIRKSLFRPFDPHTLLDDVVIPMQAIEQGARCIIEPGAIAYDLPSQSSGQESIRKRRTIAGAVQLILNQPRWLLPWRNPIWLEFVSHKLLRLVSPMLLIVVVITNILLGNASFYRWLLAGQGLFYLAAFVGLIVQKSGRRSRLLGPVLMFVSLNMTTLLALWDALRGRFHTTWRRAA